MMAKKKDDEVLYWISKFEDQVNSGMNSKKYCETNNISYAKFSNMRYRIEYTKKIHPEDYAFYLPIVRKYMEVGGSRTAFAAEHGIPTRIISEMGTHLRYVDRIEKLLKNKTGDSMNFIQIPSIQDAKPSPVISAITEILEPKNDIEIIITKGVKVSISPNIDSTKIIKIIELLKDL